MSSDPSGPSRADLARELLRYKMMEYSQDGFCATWLVDLEWDLWSAVDESNPSPTREYTVLVSRECRVLAEIADGWWVYEDETRTGETGPVFIPLTRWHEIRAERYRKQAP